MTENRKEIIQRLLSKTAEVITPEEFEQRLGSGEQLTHYIGFEISGYVHIGQGIMSALIMKDLIDLGVKCTVWLADWHTAINEKLDGTKETAARIGKGYFTEAIRACLAAVGADPDKVEFRLATDWYEKKGAEYFATMVRVMQKTTDARMKRTIDIMGRQMGDEIEADKLMYPAMQIADVFYQNIDIAHAGNDQRKVYVVMRDVARKLFPGQPKQMVLLHHLLPGLRSPDGKMSKSDPDSAIFIHDSEEFINRKIKGAFCPEKNVEQNPVMAWTKHLLFWNRQAPFIVERNPEYGGRIQFATYGELEKAYAAGEVHPIDFKAAVAKEVIALLAPIRKHFEQADILAKKAELDKVLANR